MQKIISRHFMLEILANFSIGLVIFSFIIVMGRIFQLTEMMVSQGMSFINVVMLIGLMLPNFLVFTIPMSLVLSIILTFGRASRDYEIIAANRELFGDFDPFGDFDLLFGASRLNLKIIEIPIRYRERIYGETNIKRWKHGWLLFRMAFIAAKKLKFV